MRILQTGEADELGRLLSDRLATDGHQVDTSAVSAADPDGIEAAVRAADAVIHLSTGWDNVSAVLDDAWRGALLAALRGSGKRLLYLSDASVVGDTGDSFANEDSPRSTGSAPHPWRVKAEEQVMRAVSTGIRSIVVRPALLHGHRSGILIEHLLQSAQADGAVPYVGDGEKRTSTVHADDLVALIGAAIVRAPEAATYFAASAEVLTWREVAESLSSTTGDNITARSIPGERAAAMGLDVSTMTTSTVIRDDAARRRLGWRPFGPSLGTAGQAVGSPSPKGPA